MNIRRLLFVSLIVYNRNCTSVGSAVNPKKLKFGALTIGGANEDYLGRASCSGEPRWRYWREFEPDYGSQRQRLPWDHIVTLELPRFEKAHGKTEAEIRTRIVLAIFEQKLRPNVQITEEQLAAAFDVSRTVVRGAIARLSQDGILVKRPNVGTTVASPTRKETRDMLAVRKMVEPEIASLCATSVDDSKFALISDHLKSEAEARRTGNRNTLVRLTGEFHLLIAELAGNSYAARLITGLQTLTCLAILLYADKEDACPPDEHSQIAEAIFNRDGPLAASRMLSHLKHVERDLRLIDYGDEGDFSGAVAWLRGEKHE